MKRLNLIMAFVFGVLVLLRLLHSDWLSAVTCALLALGFGLSDLQTVPAGTTAPASTLPPARKYLSMVVMCAAIALMGYQIGRDLKAATRRSKAPHSLHLSAQATAAVLGRALVATLD